jgi:hypothetical protein
MKHLALLFTVALFCVSSGFGQPQPSTSNNVAVPHLVRFAGLIKDIAGKPLTGTRGMTFALYRDQEGGSALWLETQNVAADKSGRYTVSLGLTKADGLPVELFISGEARWLGVQPDGQAEQPRVLLLSVPYALKAADAETVGGLPPSAFMLAGPLASASNSAPTAAAANPGSTNSSAPPASNLTGSGTINFLPLWTGTSTIGNSVLFQSGTGAAAQVGIGTTTPGATLDVKGAATVQGLLTSPATGPATSSGGKSSQPYDFVASSFKSSTNTAVNQTFQWRAEAASNNTTTPSGTLNLLFGSGTTPPTETGLTLSSKGLFTFAAGQTFPGTGTITAVITAPGSGLSGGGATGSLTLSLSKTCSTNQVLQWNGSAWACSSAGAGTVTGVTAGTDLTGGGTTGNLTLNLNTTATDARYAQLGGANVFTKTLTINSASQYPVQATSSASSAAAFFGHSTDTSGFASQGVLGTADGPNGVGVFGGGLGSNGIGVQGSGKFNGVLGFSRSNSTNWNANATVGVHGDTGMAGGIGVLGTTDGGTAVLGVDTLGGAGVLGSTSSGSGVLGTSGSGPGVTGTSTSASGVQGVIGGATLNTAGVYGRAGNGTSFGGIAGVWGDADQHVGVFGSSNGFAGVAGQSQNGYGLQGISNGADGVNGTSHTVNGSGVAGINDAPGGLGVYGHSSNGGFGFYTDSNAAQARGTGGWVKVVAYVDPFAQGGVAITRCYNSQASGATVSTPPCGISIVHNAAGGNTLDFGFQVNDRFIGVSCPTSVVIASADTSSTPPNQVATSTWNAQAAIYDDFPFTIFVY